MTSSEQPAAGPSDTRGASHHLSVLTDRRALFRGAVVVVGAGALAACSSSSGSSGSDAGGGATPAAGGPTPTSEIPVGGGKIFAEEKVVVTQPEAGTFKAFDATCTHQGCTVATIADKKIICPCHGSAYDIATGDVVNGPAPAPLAAKTVTVTGDTFTVS